MKNDQSGWLFSIIKKNSKSPCNLLTVGNFNPMNFEYNAKVLIACENSRPSSLPARNETPRWPGAWKDGCFRRIKF